MLNIRHLHNLKASQIACNTTLHDTPKQRLMEAFVRPKSQPFVIHKHLIIIILHRF